MFRLTIRMLLMVMALVIVIMQASNTDGVPVPVKTTTKTYTYTPPGTSKDAEGLDMEVARNVTIGFQSIPLFPEVPKKVNHGLETFTTYSFELEDQFRMAMAEVRPSTSTSTTPGMDMVIDFFNNFVKLLEPSTGKGTSTEPRMKGKVRKIAKKVLGALKPVVDFLVKSKEKGTLARDVQSIIDYYAEGLEAESKSRSIRSKLKA